MPNIVPNHSQRPRIAIVGGGPAGLTLAVVLKRHGWSATIFEAEVSADARDQGGSLDLHPEEGQRALAMAGLLDAFMAVARHEDQEQRVLDHATAAVLHEEIPEPGAGERPEIDRILLRRLLLDAIDPADVQWCAPVREVVAHPRGGHGLLLSSGIAGPFDLIVGADGAWSRVRRALTSEKPRYTGVTFIELWLSDVDVRHAAIARMVGRGTMFALGEGKGVIAQRNGGNMIRVYAALRIEPGEGERSSPGMMGREEVMRRFDGWAPALRDLIANVDQIAAVRPIVALPPGLDWPARTGLTLIGDAAHVMPPLGVGVNLAMLDAAELAEALVTASDWRTAVSSFECAIRARAREAAQMCEQGFAQMFGTNGSQALLDQFARSDGHL